MRLRRRDSQALRASKIGLFAALYTIASLIPFSVFIGASSVLSLNLVITPVIAILLTPIEAGSAALIGGLLSLWVAPNQAMFGIGTITLPFVGAVFGSLSFHKPKIGPVVSWTFLMIVVLLYLAARPGFPYWIAPHLLSILVSATTIFSSSTKAKVISSSFNATMCEQAAMLIQAVYVLRLPVIVFITAFPLMLYERLIGTIGASFLIFGLTKFTSKHFGTNRASAYR